MSAVLQIRNLSKNEIAINHHNPSYLGRMEYYKSSENITDQMEGGESRSRSIGLDAIFQYTGSGVQFFSGMIFYLIIVRLFSTTAVGAIALFLAIIGLFQIVFSFGLGTAAQHFTSYSIGLGDFAAAAKVFYKIITYGFLVSIFGFLSLLLLSPVISISFLHSNQYTNLIRLLSIVLLGSILFSILNGTLLGLQNFRLSAFINIIIWIAYYFGSIAFAYLIHNLSALIAGWSMGIFLGVIIELTLILKVLSKFKGGALTLSTQSLIKYSLPVVLSGLIGYSAAYADRFIVAGLINLSSLGVYNFALLISSSLGFLAIPFNNILMPKFSELFGRGERALISAHVKASSMLLMSIYVPASLGISALAPVLIGLLGGPNYAGGSAPLSLVMFLSAFFVSSNILTQAIASVRRTKIFIYSSVVGFGSNVILSYLLIPKFGLVGAALGFSSVFASTFFVLYFFAKVENVASFDISGTVKIWIASLVMFITVFILINRIGTTLYLMPIYILVGICIYLGA